MIDIWKDFFEDYMPETGSIWDYTAKMKEAFQPPLYDELYANPRTIVRRAQSVQEQEDELTPTPLSAFVGAYSVHATVMNITLAETYEQRSQCIPHRNNRVPSHAWEFDTKEQDRMVYMERGTGDNRSMRVGRIAASRKPDIHNGRM